MKRDNAFHRAENMDGEFCGFSFKETDNVRNLIRRHPQVRIILSGNVAIARRRGPQESRQGIVYAHSEDAWTEAHQSRDFRDVGVTPTLCLDTGSDKRGLTMLLTPEWGKNAAAESKRCGKARG